MKTEIQHETIRQQCKSLSELPGYKANLVLFRDKINSHTVKIVKNNKILRLSDPDLDVIIAQLAHIYLREKRAVTNYSRKSRA